MLLPLQIPQFDGRDRKGGLDIPPGATQRVRGRYKLSVQECGTEVVTKAPLPHPSKR